MHYSYPFEQFLATIRAKDPFTDNPPPPKPTIPRTKTIYDLVACAPIGSFRMTRLREAIDFDRSNRMTELLWDWVSSLTEPEKKAVVAHETAHKTTYESVRAVLAPYSNGLFVFNLSVWENIHLGTGNRLPKLEEKMTDLLDSTRGPRTGKANYELVNPAKRRSYVL